MRDLFEYFDILAETQGGVKKLREMILQFAVQGKLVPQNPNDEPASVLLEKIRIEKERLLIEGKIKNQKPLEPIRDSEIPFDLPTGWRWSKLGDISLKVHYGYTASADRNIDDVRLLRITDIQNDSVNWSTVPGCQIEKRQIEQYSLSDGDIVIARTGGTIGKTYLVENINVCAVFASYLIRIVPSASINTKFIKQFTLSLTYWQQLYEKSTGTGQPNVNGVSLSNLLLPLPPLAEQKRIVAKVDSLMALCDDLEKQQQEKAEKKQTLNKASLHALNNSSTKQDFNKTWNHITKNFDLFYSTPENVKDLKQTILQLAVQGKLVPQDPNDEPASVLLKRIKEEKERLVKEGKIKKQKPLELIRDSEIPFELPIGWEWCRLGDLHFFMNGFAFKSNTYIRDSKNQIIRLGNVKNEGLLLKQKPAYIPDSIAKVSLIYKLNTNDLLLTMTGTKNKRDYCFTTIVGEESLVDCDLYLNQRVGCLRFLSSIDVSLMNFFLKANSLLDFLFDSSTGTANQANIGVDSIRSCKIPLPPLPEQHRIVAKVDSLMALCDSLSKNLTDKETRSEKLLNAVVNQL